MNEKPIALVTIDNDGCLVRDELSNYNLDFAEKMREYSRRSKASPGKPFPQFTFLTGRPQPFVECMQKLFEVSLPAVFENGAGVDLGGQSMAELDPRIDDDALDRLARARSLLRRTVMKEIPSFIQPGKDGSVSVIAKDPADRPRMFEACQALTELTDLGFRTVRGARAVDVLLPGIDKGSGFDRLLAKLDRTPDEVGGIGDTSGDVVFLEKCAFSGAPANAVDAVRECVDYVSPYEAEAGVLDIMNRIVQRNMELSG